MAGFAGFSNILPDPNNWIGMGGETDNIGGSPGAGFASMKLSSVDSLLNSKTNSGRLETRVASFHKWELALSYHPMTREEFDPVYTFLMHMKNTMQSFFVQLPNYNIGGSLANTLRGDHVKGETVIDINAVWATVLPPLIFNIGNETKIYMINRVENSSNYFLPFEVLAAGEERYHITPGMQKDNINGSTINFYDPMLYVQQIGDISYTIDSKNLYKFSLKLEEIPANV